MISFAKADVGRVAVCALGTLTLSAVSVFAAAAPAHAAEPASAAAWQERAQHALTALPIVHVAPGHPGRVLVDAHFDADGRFDHAGLVRSSGDAAVDGECLQAVARAGLPRMPAGLRGQPRSVHVRLYYGASEAEVADAMGRHLRYADEIAPVRLVAR